MLTALARKLRFEPDDVGYILPFEEVVDALGRVAEHDLGLQTIPLDSIVGTVDRTQDFDRAFRPTSPRLRARWQRIAEAQRRGEAFPPISGYRVGERPRPRARVPRRSRCPASASCTSCATATTACRSPARSAVTTSTPTSP